MAIRRVCRKFTRNFHDRDSTAVRLRRTAWVAAGLAVCLAGCGSPKTPELGEVQGRVLLDGKPLPYAAITFQPTKGSPSYGQTDENGDYELSYKRDINGAIVGRHTVSITTARSELTEGGTVEFPEKLPPHYHVKSSLGRDVQPGSNVINFDLSSDYDASDDGSVGDDASDDDASDDDASDDDASDDDASDDDV